MRIMSRFQDNPTSINRTLAVNLPAKVEQQPNFPKLPSVESTEENVRGFFKHTERVSQKLSENGSFDYNNAAYKFLKGLVFPIISIFSSKENLIAAGVVVALTLSSPVFATTLATVALVYGLYKAGEFLVNAYKAYKAKDGDQFEKAFEGLGEGAGNILSGVSLKSSASKSSSLIKESKLISQLPDISKTIFFLRSIPKILPSGAIYVSQSLKNLTQAVYSNLTAPSKESREEASYKLSDLLKKDNHSLQTAADPSLKKVDLNENNGLQDQAKKIWKSAQQKGYEIYSDISNNHQTSFRIYKTYSVGGKEIKKQIGPSIEIPEKPESLASRNKEIIKTLEIHLENPPIIISSRIPSYYPALIDYLNSKELYEEISNNKLEITLETLKNKGSLLIEEYSIKSPNSTSNKYHNSFVLADNLSKDIQRNLNILLSIKNEKPEAGINIAEEPAIILSLAENNKDLLPALNIFKELTPDLYNQIKKSQERGVFVYLTATNKEKVTLTFGNNYYDQVVNEDGSKKYGAYLFKKGEIEIAHSEFQDPIALEKILSNLPSYVEPERSVLNSYIDQINAVDGKIEKFDVIGDIIRSSMRTMISPELDSQQRSEVIKNTIQLHLEQTALQGIFSKSATKESKLDPIIKMIPDQESNLALGDELRYARLLTTILKNHLEKHPDITITDIETLKLPLLHALQKLEAEGYHNKIGDPELCLKIIGYIKEKRKQFAERILIDRDTKLITLFDWEAWMPDKSSANDLARKYNIPAENVKTIKASLSFFGSNLSKMNSFFTEIKESLSQTNPKFKRITIILDQHGNPDRLSLGEDFIMLSRFQKELENALTTNNKQLEVNIVVAGACFSYDYFEKVGEHLNNTLPKNSARPLIIPASLKGNLSYGEADSKLQLFVNMKNNVSSEYRLTHLLDFQATTVLPNLERNVKDFDITMANSKHYIRGNQYTVFAPEIIDFEDFLKEIGLESREGRKSKFQLELSSILKAKNSPS